MVAIDPPPPKHRPRPIFRDLPVKSRLVRLFDPTSHGATKLHFRTFGPILRFDHQRGEGERRLPCTDLERGIYYAAHGLSSCLVEIFGDTGVIDFGEWHVASPVVGQELHLLDLTGAGAMRAGSVAALAKIPERPRSQEWSRFFYEVEETYPNIDGLVFLNAHNDEEAFALYERAATKLHCSDQRVIRLDDPSLRAHVLKIAEDNNLIFDVAPGTPPLPFSSQHSGK